MDEQMQKKAGRKAGTPIMGDRGDTVPYQAKGELFMQGWIKYREIDSNIE